MCSRYTHYTCDLHKVVPSLFLGRCHNRENFSLCRHLSKGPILTKSFPINVAMPMAWVLYPGGGGNQGGLLEVKNCLFLYLRTNLCCPNGSPQICFSNSEEIKGEGIRQGLRHGAIKIYPLPAQKLPLPPCSAHTTTPSPAAG